MEQAQLGLTGREPEEAEGGAGAGEAAVCEHLRSALARAVGLRATSVTVHPDSFFALWIAVKFVAEESTNAATVSAAEGGMAKRRAWTP